VSLIKWQIVVSFLSEMAVDILFSRQQKQEVQFRISYVVTQGSKIFTVLSDKLGQQFFTGSQN